MGTSENSSLSLSVTPPPARAAIGRVTLNAAMPFPMKMKLRTLGSWCVHVSSLAVFYCLAPAPNALLYFLLIEFYSEYINHSEAKPRISGKNTQ